MTDLEISKALALAIGWEEWQIEVTPFDVKCLIGNWCTRVFDYRDWNVIGPIAERYKCFPYSWYHNAGVSCWRSVTEVSGANADTPQKAIAMAVIGASK